MSEEEKKTIEDCKELVQELKQHKDKDFIGRLYYKNKPVEDILSVLLNLIERLQEENFKIKHIMRNPCDISIERVNNTIERLEKALTEVEQMPPCATRYDTIQRLSNQIEILEELKESGGE